MPEPCPCPAIRVPPSSAESWLPGRRRRSSRARRVCWAPRPCGGAGTASRRVARPPACRERCQPGRWSCCSRSVRTRMFVMARSVTVWTAELLSLPRVTSALTSRSKSCTQRVGVSLCALLQTVSACTHVSGSHGGRGEAGRAQPTSCSRQSSAAGTQGARCPPPTHLSMRTAQQ